MEIFLFAPNVRYVHPSVYSYIHAFIHSFIHLMTFINYTSNKELFRVTDARHFLELLRELLLPLDRSSSSIVASSVVCSAIAIAIRGCCRRRRRRSRIRACVKQILGDLVSVSPAIAIEDIEVRADIILQNVENGTNGDGLPSHMKHELDQCILGYIAASCSRVFHIFHSDRCLFVLPSPAHFLSLDEKRPWFQLLLLLIIIFIFGFNEFAWFCDSRFPRSNFWTSWAELQYQNVVQPEAPPHSSLDVVVFHERRRLVTH